MIAQTVSTVAGVIVGLTLAVIVFWVAREVYRKVVGIRPRK